MHDRRALLIVYNQEACTGRVLHRWKKAHCAPPPRGRTRLMAIPAPNQPVALPSRLSKLLEQMVSRRQRDFLRDKLQSPPSSFRPQRPNVGLWSRLFT